MDDEHPSFDAAVDAWSETLDIAPSDADRFDPGATIRTIQSAAEETVDLEEALERLPRLTTDDESPSGRLPDLQFLGSLGEGGMGTVRLAVQVPVGREIATKQVRPQHKIGPEDRTEALQNLLREAWITGYLEHPNIVPIYRVGSDANGEPVIVMKRIEGVSWQEVLDEPSAAPDELGDDPLTWHLEVLSQVCNAVEYAHDRGILHRDLKPENVMLGEFGEVYIVDWGIAASIGDAAQNDRIPSLDEVTTQVGTPAYIAPEMIAASEDTTIDERSDVYLLGGILHAILTGAPPHEGTTMIQVLADIRESGRPTLPESTPEPLADICRRALDPEPEHRFESVDQFQDALREYLRHRESTAMSEEAHRRLDELKEALAGEEPAGDLREEFAACRFGFEQALELSPKNESAREGLQELLELMIERELEREEYQAASNYLADLPEPAPELRERVEELGERIHSRRERLEELQEYRRESDVEVGRHARSVFVLVVGGLSVMLNITPVAWGWVTGSEPPSTVPLATFILYAAGLAGLIYRSRHALIQNEANRKLMLSFLVVLGGDGISRILDAIHGTPRALMAPQKAILLATVFGVLAIAMDLRLLWVSIPFVVVAGLQVLFPAHVLPLAAGGVAVASILLARAWWAEDASPTDDTGDGERARS